MTLDEAAARYRAAQVALEQADAARTAAHHAHVATIPLLGRLHVGNGDPSTRKAHHAACARVAAARQALDCARDELVAAALDATAPLALELDAA